MSMSSDALEKILRLSGAARPQEAADDLRSLVHAAHTSLTEACQSHDLAEAAELVLAAQACVDRLATVLYTEGTGDWVEATAGPDPFRQTHEVSLASTAGTWEAGYADPGYHGKQHFPLGERAALSWAHICQPRNATRYTASQLARIKAAIKVALHQQGAGLNVEASAGAEVPVLVQLAAPPAGSLPIDRKSVV